MKRFHSSVFAVVLLMSASMLLHAQEARITVPLGWYSLPEFAQALSTPERTVICRSDLSQRVALVHLKERSWEEVRALVQEIGLRIEPSGKGRWRLEWLPSVELRERRWRVQIAQARDRQLLERMRQIREQVPVLPERYWKEYFRLTLKMQEQVHTPDPERPDVQIFDFSKIGSLRLEDWTIPPEILNWARQLAQLPEDILPSLLFWSEMEEEPVEYRLRLALCQYHVAVENYLWYALARLWEYPEYRLSYQEIYEQGGSVRVVPLTTVLELAPEARPLIEASSRVIVWSPDGDAPTSKATAPPEDLYLVYSVHALEYMTNFYMKIKVISSETDYLTPSAFLPLTTYQGQVQERQSSLWERAREFYQPVWQEARPYVEQAQRNTKTALEHPALQKPFDPEGLTKASWSRWVYQWAKQTGNEVLMLLYPSQDPLLKSPSKPTLAELYQLSATPQKWFVPAWITLQMREGVLISDVLNGCVVRLRDYPLASLKRLCERWDALEYKDYVEYYRSVLPRQNRWWFMDIVQPRIPFVKAFPTDNDYKFHIGSLWFGIYLIERLSAVQRGELFRKGQVEVDLMRLPEAVRRELVGLMRNAWSSYGYFTKPEVLHPNWLLVPRQYPNFEPSPEQRYPEDYPFLAIRVERESLGEGKSRLRLRFAPNPLSVITYYFRFDMFETPYNRWLFDQY